MTIRNLEVSPVTFNKEIVGYSVSGVYRQCSDSFWEPITHNAIFRTKERAVRLLQVIKKTNSWNLKMANWNVGHSWDGTYSVL